MNNNITTKGLSLMNSKELFTTVINCLVMIFICKISFAQNIKNNHPEDHYRAIHWTFENGLSHTDNYNMLKDSKGFLWIASGKGLNKFDGNTFKYYFSDTTLKTSIAGDDIQGLSEDSLHNIWIGTTRGISRYDIRADTFTTLSSVDGIVPFWARRNEMLCWDYKEQAIVSYNIYSFARKIVASFSATDSLGGNLTIFMCSIFDEAEKSIWMLTGETKLGGLLQVSLTDLKRKYYFWPVNKKNRVSGRDHYIGAEAMRYDRKRNCIWINSPEGLINFTLNDKQFHQIDALEKYTNLKGYDRFVGIDIDLKGRIWFATQPKGIIIYNPADQSVELPFPNDSALQVDAGKFNACLYCDRDGLIWTGSWLKTGIYEIAPFSRTVTHYRWKPKMDHSLNHDDVFWFAQGPGGKVWIATGAGIDIFDPLTGNFDAFTNLPGFSKAEDNHDIRPVYIDTVSKKAIIEYKGLLQLDLDTKKSQPVIFKDSAGHVINRSANEGYFSRKFKNGCITIALHDKKNGVFIIDRDSAVASELLSLPAEETFSFFNLINDSLVFIPLGPYGSGMHLTYAYDGHKLVRTHILLDSIPWIEIAYNKADQTYWVSTERQLTHYNKDFHIIRKFTPKEGLPIFDISCLTLDNSNNLWFHTDHSIHQLNTETGEFSQLTEKDGFDKIDFFNYPGNFKADNGDIYFPTGTLAQGFVRISPAKYLSPVSSVYIENIDINQRPISLSSGANNLEEIALRYFENKINISTGIIDFYSKGKSNIRYRLEGRDSNWQYSSYYSTIRYEGLPTGKKYRLMMQASNASNEFNGPMKSLFIYISPAFWDTWWFRIPALITLGLLFYAIIRWRLQQRFRLQLERSEKEIQIAEMKSKATELEMQALRAQMNPHFIFNSLNSINRFILQNNRAQASEYLTKFSKLVRLILQNSQASLITLESELESLELYLNLEALRFDYHFDYKISIPDDMDVEVLKVPPLILQPYVENAIWHGLMHKEEKGQLSIAITEENDYLFFRITDNGIGRKQAVALASKSATKHKSMGLRITAHRIAILQNNESLQSPVTICDLVNADGSAAGTEVLIKMPVLYD